MKKTGKTKTCPICGTSFYVKRRNFRPVNTCSMKCKGAVIRQSRWAEIEDNHGGKPIKEVLESYYYGQKLGIKKTARAIGVSDRVLWDWFEALNIPRRSRSDAVANQWTDNDERRKAQAEFLGDATKEYYASGGINPAKLPEIRKKIRESKQGENNPMWGKFGEENGNWKGGKVTYRGKGWKGIRTQIIRRDNNQCCRCGGNNDLQVHHIIPYRETADNSFKNLVTLCQECHTKVEYHGATWD